MTINTEDLNEAINILFNPKKYGYKDCEACDGFGDISENKDIQLIEACDVCDGDGVVPDPDRDLPVFTTTCSILEEMGVTVPEKNKS